MDATGVRSSQSVAGFELICKNAIRKSKLSLSGHVSGDAYLLALTNSLSASTGVEINKWGLGGQFEINSRGAEYVPAAYLSASRRHLSQTPVDNFFSEASHRDTYSNFAGGAKETSSGARVAADDISAEQLTPKRPACLLNHSIPVKQAYEMIVALTGLTAAVAPLTVLKVIQDSDTQVLMSIAALVAVPPGDVPEVYEAALTAAIVEIFTAVSTSPATPARTPRSPSDFIKSAERSIRDEAAADDTARSVIASLSYTRSLLRLTVKALVRRRLVASVFIPIDTLPSRVVLQLHPHLLLQDAVLEIVRNSIQEGADASRGSVNLIVSERVAAMDVFLAEQVDSGLACHFTPFEATYGIFSIGCMAALVATLNYVPGVAPAVLRLIRTAQDLHFGSPGKAYPVDYRSTYALFVEALHEVDRYDLVFDIKALVTLLVDALDRKGTRGSTMWDDMLLAALRCKNQLLQAQSAARTDLDDILLQLNKMRRYQENFDSLRNPPSSLSDYSLQVASLQVSRRADEFEPYDESHLACKVGYGPARIGATRKCRQGVHDVPFNVDFCGLCSEFLDDVVVCPICHSPTKKHPDPLLQQCRGRFNLVPCNVNNTAPRHQGFRVPTSGDIHNAKERFRRLTARDEERASRDATNGSRAYTVLIQPPPPASQATPLTLRSAAFIPGLAPYAPCARVGTTVTAPLFTSSPSAHPTDPAPITQIFNVRASGAALDFDIVQPGAGRRTAETLAHDNLATPRLTSPGIQVLTSDQTGNVPHDASYGSIARSSLPAVQDVKPPSGLAPDSAAATQVSFQLVLPGQDVPKHRRRAAAPAATHQAAPQPPASAKERRASRRAALRNRKKKFVAGPPIHPLIMEGKPIAIDVLCIEVRDQPQPLFSLGVLEKAAKLAGILLRLETCPAEDGASWLLLDGIGRYPVSRIGGLVLIGFRMLSPGHILFGCRGANSALIDTGAQVCLFSAMSKLDAYTRTTYSGPVLRGADNAVVDTRSATTFTLHFDLETILPCMPKAAVVTTAPPLPPVVDASGSMAVFSVMPEELSAGPSKSLGGRDSQRRKLRGVDVLHTRFGITDPAVFRALRKSAVGIDLPDTPSTRFTSLAYVQQAAVRTAIRHEKLIQAKPLPGESASLDFTRSFVLDMDGNVCAAVMLDIATYSLWVYPLRAKTGSEAARAVRAYRVHVRERYRTELRALRADSDPSFSANGHGESTLAADLHLALRAELPHVVVTFSPPYAQAMNPVEGAVGHLFHLLNFFLAQAYLSMLAWCDVLRASARILNCLPRPQSSIVKLRSKSPDELSTGKKPDLSKFIGAPGQLMAVHEPGSKASACNRKARLALYVMPSGGGSLVRDVVTWRSYVTHHARVVSSDVNGIAAQAIAVSHALNTPAVRSRIGFNAASATEVSSSVRRLVGSGTELWTAREPDTVALIDPLTGLAVRLVHVNVDGSLALVPDDDAVSRHTLAEKVPVPQLQAPPVIAPSTRDSIVGPTPAIAASSSSTLNKRPLGRMFKAWVRALPADTAIAFNANIKSGKSAQRYAAYRTAGTVGAYRLANSQAAFVHEDLAFDLSRGLAQLPPMVWDQRVCSSVLLSPSTVLTHSDDATESLYAFTVRVAVQVPDDFCADPLHARATRLSAVSPSLQAAAAFEALEDGSPSPPYVGGALVQQLLHEGALLASTVGLREDLRSVKAMMIDPLWDAPGGWKAKALIELNMVINEKKALVPLTRKQYIELRSRYGDRCEHIQVLTLGSVKHLADGTPGRLKVRTVVTDVKKNSTFQGETFSGAVDDSVIRWITAATLGRPGLKRRILDVKAAYYQGEVATPEAGGRVLIVTAPAGWGELGFPEVDAQGYKVHYQVVRNVPGRQDAGRIWQTRYDGFFASQQFTQSIVDRRVFYKHLPGGKLFVVGVYVDDNWTICDDDPSYDEFHTAWKKEFDESENVTQAADDFCGILTEDLPKGAVALSSKKLLLALHDMVREYECPSHVCTPMLHDSPAKMREVGAPLREDLIPKARSIVGLGLFVVRGSRPDGLFAGVCVSQHIVVNLTEYVWECALRWTYYLVRTMHYRLILRPPALVDGLPVFMANSDSSCINSTTGDIACVDGGAAAVPGVVSSASMGGYSLFFQDSGVVVAECFSPRRLSDSSAGSELIMASWAGKGIIAYRMLHRELFGGCLAPTALELDATAVMDSAAMERVTRKQRFNAARLAMLRQWIEDRALYLKKLGTDDMRSDIFTKAVYPVEKFRAMAFLVLTGRTDGVELQK